MARHVLGSRSFALGLILLARVSMAMQFQSIAPAGPLLVADLTLSYAELGLLIGFYLLRAPRSPCPASCSASASAIAAWSCRRWGSWSAAGS
jgi:hypothetical protein